ncbi:MAG: cation diffusion facilitator family transporter [Myxococcaceae bacterium]|nr:cation diffusion facilitator family transporter [Myxococcaceae bacterium]
MAHDHSHAAAGHTHAAGHAHGPPSGGRAFAIGIALNLAFVVLEAVFGILSRSMALLADAGHNLSDVLGLGLAWGAMLLARRAPSPKRTYGLRGTTILASVANSVVLLFVAGGVAWESARRLVSPEPIASMTVIYVALAGVVVNGASALLFLKDRKTDLNVRSAFLHLASDAALSFGVAIAGAVMLLTSWWWLDPIVSIALSLFILAATWSLLKSSLHLAVQGVPEHVDVTAVRSYLSSVPGVIEVHDLHVWSMSTTDVALTAHLVMPNEACTPTLLGEVAARLHDEFAIEHSTIQVCPPEAPECVLAPEGRI